MTSPLFAAPDPAAIPLYLVRPDDLEGVLAGLSDMARAWVRAHEFRASHGQVLVIPDPKGGLLAVLVGLGSDGERERNRFALGGARPRLPAGTFALETTLDGDALAAEYLGWLLAGYGFGRYREATPPKAELVGPQDPGTARRLEAIAAGEVLTRDLVNTPAADMGPAELAAAAATLAQEFGAGIDVIEGDALRVDPLAHLTPPIRIAANLPYNVGTELLVRWLTPADWPPFWESLTLMFQREVAERIVARPGSKAYGRLAILAQWRAETRIVMSLPPGAFTPPPKVASAVVHLVALPAPRFPAPPEFLERVVAAAFNQRRKMLRASLRGLSPSIEDHLEAVGIRPTDRAETVPLDAFCALARSLAAE